MPVDKHVPVVGGAMPIMALEKHRDWILEKQRDLELQDFAMPVILDSDAVPMLIRMAREALDGYQGRLGIHGPFWDLPLAAYDPLIRAVVQQRLLQALDFGAEIGAGHMVVHSPLAFLGAPDSLTAPHVGPADLFELTQETLAPVVARASANGCMLVIETIWDRDPRLLTELVASFASPFVRQSVDVGHAYIIHREVGAPPPDYFIRTAGALLGHVHLQDTDGYADRHWAIGEGSLPWPAIFAAIGETGASPRLILELDNHLDLERSARWLAGMGLAQ
jgi:sugar phosphate isomerase/epimerase